MRRTWYSLKHQHHSDARSSANLARMRELWATIGEPAKEGVRQRLGWETPDIKPPTRFTSTAPYLKYTQGTAVPLSYWESGTTTTSSAWSDLFSERYLQNGYPTAPLFTCPFCFHREALSYAQKGSPSRKEESSAQAFMRYQEQVLKSRARQYNPSEMQRHLAHLHPLDGWDPSQLQIFNKTVMTSVKKRIYAGEEGVPPVSLVVLLDVANLELGNVKAFVDLLKDRHSLNLFETFPVLICAVQELLIPHTSIVLHVAYQLAQLHPYSDFYTLYSVTRAEAGDLLSTWVVGALHWGAEEASLALPPVVLLTMDSQQKICMSEIFGGGSTLVSPPGTLRTTRQIQLPFIVQALKEALESTSYRPY